MNMKEKPKNHGKFEAAEELLATSKSLEELLEYRNLMLEHLHRFEAMPGFGEKHPIIVGFTLLVSAIEARIRFKEFLIAHGERDQRGTIT